MGRERNEEPDTTAQGRNPLPEADPAQVARAPHEFHWQRGRLAGAEVERRRPGLFQGAGALLGPVPHRQENIPLLQVSVQREKTYLYICLFFLNVTLDNLIEMIKKEIKIVL